MFIVVDPETGWKGNLIIRRDRPFSIAEFERRSRTELLGVALDVASIEDVVISKLEWAQLGGSSRQLEDVRTLVRLAAETLDRPYVARWVKALHLDEEWRAATEA